MVIRSMKLRGDGIFFGYLVYNCEQLGQGFSVEGWESVERRASKSKVIN